MKYVKQSCVIFGITMAGELFNDLLPLPIPAGVYGLFLLLTGLCAGAVKLEQVEETGSFLLEIMPLMFIPVTVGLIEDYEMVKTAAIPLAVISVVSTIAVMAATGKATEVFLALKGRKEKKQ